MSKAQGKFDFSVHCDNYISLYKNRKRVYVKEEYSMDLISKTVNS